MAALGDEMRHADYFFFLDADVRFMEEVNLVDIGADLMGVEHPMYPRYVVHTVCGGVVWSGVLCVVCGVWRVAYGVSCIVHRVV